MKASGNLKVLRVVMYLYLKNVYLLVNVWKNRESGSSGGRGQGLGYP